MTEPSKREATLDSIRRDIRIAAENLANLQAELYDIVSCLRGDDSLPDETGNTISPPPRQIDQIAEMIQTCEFRISQSRSIAGSLRRELFDQTTKALQEEALASKERIMNEGQAIRRPEF